MADMKIGSSDWFTAQADKLIDAALGVAVYKINSGANNGVPTGQASNTSNTSSTLTSGLMEKLPLILGVAAIGGIVYILIKR
jgi:hypothetical protein